MIELKCDRCGENCGLNARVIDIHVVHNPNPVRFGDIGEIHLTDDNTHIRYMLCQNCYDRGCLQKGVFLKTAQKRNVTMRFHRCDFSKKVLCKHAHDKQGLPNPYRTGEKLADEIRNSGTD